MVEIVGIKRMEGTSKKTNKPYSGYMIWYIQEEAGVTGKSADSAFVSDTILGGQIPEVGGFAELRYNKNGFLTEATFTRY